MIIPDDRSQEAHGPEKITYALRPDAKIIRFAQAPSDRHVEETVFAVALGGTLSLHADFDT